MTLLDQFNKWKETTLKKSLDKFKERKGRFETSAGIEVPRLAMPDGNEGRGDLALHFHRESRGAVLQSRRWFQNVPYVL